MNEYGYKAEMSDHDRVLSSGAWLGAMAVMAACGWLDGHMPHACGFALNWAAVLAVCYGMAAWKRAWYAWAAFWAMAATCLVAGVLQLAGAMAGPWSVACWCVASAMVFIWYWLIRMPRLQPAVQAVERREVHVFHHVIHHGQELRGPVTAQVTGVPARRVIAGTAQAIGPARVRGAITAARARRLP